MERRQCPEAELLLLDTDVTVASILVSELQDSEQGGLLHLTGYQNSPGAQLGLRAYHAHRKEHYLETADPGRG